MLEVFAGMDDFTEERAKAAVFADAAGLKGWSATRRIVSDGKHRTVLDGPFAEAGEVILGFSIWQVKDMDEAIAWAKRASDPMPGRRSEMEIRPLYEAADLVDFLSPEELAAAARDGKRGKLGVA